MNYRHASLLILLSVLFLSAADTLPAEGITLPGASSKIEGGLADRTAVASDGGSLHLLRNEFFDRQIFDPKRFE